MTIKNPKTSPSPIEPHEDLLKLCDGDTLARRIFLAYTTRIPWTIGQKTPITRQEEACYIFTLPGRS
ncbi:MAG TPA: hypothetical protein VIH99_02255 [Bdellovibrionota bacterium]|jgi:hypothetical protein